MVDLALRIHVLPRAHHHILGRSHVHQGRFAGVRMRNPDGDGESVGRPAEDDGDGAREMEEQRRHAIGESCGGGSLAGTRDQVARRSRTVDIGPRRQRRVLGQRLGNVVVGPVDVVVFLRGRRERGSQSVGAARLERIGESGSAHLSGRCTASSGHVAGPPWLLARRRAGAIVAWPGAVVVGDAVEKDAKS